MIKIKSRSLVINEPVAPELQEHVHFLIQKQEEQMRSKLDKQNQKEARIQAIEKQFVEWADRKECIIREKLEKSVKNKEDHLNKIVKKCKDHQKFISQKYKNIQTKKRAHLNNAWKKAEQFNHSIQDYQQSKLLYRDNHPHRDKNKDGITQSRFLAHKHTYKENQKTQYITQSLNNPSKYMSNASKDYWAELNQSYGPQQKKVVSLPKQEREEEQTPLKIHHTSKLKETIARFKQNLKNQEQDKIQQLAERLKKIQKSRHKKVQLHKKKKQHHEADYLETEPVDRKKPKKNNERSQRINSQTIVRQKRVRDWTEYNKHKREQYLQNHIQHGNNYLQQQKIKQMKTNLAKKITVSAIEKKLYFQRLNH